MFNFDLEKMLFTIPVGKHSVKDVAEILNAHPEVKFVSLVGIDIAGHATDDPVEAPKWMILANAEQRSPPRLRHPPPDVVCWHLRRSGALAQ